MKKNVVTALVVALVLAVSPAGGHVASIVASASENNTVTGSDNNTKPEEPTTPEKPVNPGVPTTPVEPSTPVKPSIPENTGSGNNTVKPGPGAGNGSEISTGAPITVVTSDGKEIVSTIPTSNTSVDVKSVAMSTERGAVYAAVGLTSDRIANGEFVKLTVAPSQCGELAKQAVTNAASAIQGKVATILEIDLDILGKNGAIVEELTELAAPVEFVISAPANVDANAYDFAMVRLHDGKTDILPDLDNDPATITFATDKFSVYAVVYGEKGSFDGFKGAAMKDRVPKTGDAMIPVLPIVAMGGVFAAVAVLLKKKAQA